MRPTASAPAPCAPLGRWPDLSGLGRSSSNVGASLLAMLVVKVRATVLRGLAETSDPVHSGRALLPLRSAGNRAPRGPAHTRAQGREVLIRPHARAISFGDRRPRPTSAAQPRCTPSTRGPACSPAKPVLILGGAGSVGLGRRANHQPSGCGHPHRRLHRQSRTAAPLRGRAPLRLPPAGIHPRPCPLRRHHKNCLSFRGVCHLLDDKLFRPSV